MSEENTSHFYFKDRTWSQLHVTYLLGSSVGTAFITLMFIVIYLENLLTNIPLIF